MRPWIGIVGELVSGENGEKTELRLAQRYVDAVERAGGAPCAVPFVRGARFVDELLERLDGLVFTGADDFDTERLGLGPTHPRASPVPALKQDFDLALARRALSEGLPTLGICYGMQLLALADGGTLHQHLPEDRPGCQEHSGGTRHRVELEAGTKLRACLGVGSLVVVSRHHQAVAEVGPRWRISAADEEGLIEAIEQREHPFALGVQWHPELSPANDPPARVFSALIEAASTHARSRISAEAR